MPVHIKYYCHRTSYTVRTPSPLFPHPLPLLMAGSPGFFKNQNISLPHPLLSLNLSGRMGDNIFGEHLVIFFCSTSRLVFAVFILAEFLQSLFCAPSSMFVVGTTTTLPFHTQLPSTSLSHVITMSLGLHTLSSAPFRYYHR